MTYVYREDFQIGDPLIAEEWNSILKDITDGTAIKAEDFRDAVIPPGVLAFEQLDSDAAGKVLNTKRIDALLLNTNNFIIASPANNLNLSASLSPSGNVIALSENQGVDQDGCPIVQVESIWGTSEVVGTFVETAFGTPANCGLLIDAASNRVVTQMTSEGTKSVFVSMELSAGGIADGTEPFDNSSNKCRLYFFFIDSNGYAQPVVVNIGTYQFFYGRRYNFGHMPESSFRDVITSVLDMPSPDDITLQHAYDNGSGNILTDVTRGALAIQRGSTADTDNVLEIRDGMNQVNLSILGNGNLTGKDARFDKVTSGFLQLDISSTSPSFDPTKPAIWYEESGTPGDGQFMGWDGTKPRILG